MEPTQRGERTGEGLQAGADPPRSNVRDFIDRPGRMCQSADCMSFDPDRTLEPIAHATTSAPPVASLARRAMLGIAGGAVALVVLTAAAMRDRGEDVRREPSPDVSRGERPASEPNAGAAERAGSGGPAAGQAGKFAERLDVDTFLRGNLHAHSARSDGDSPARAVLSWYKRHGYDFVALTDHDKILDAAALRAASSEAFVVLPGEEVTMMGGGLPVHLNALCTTRRIGGGNFQTPAAALSWATGEVLQQGGVALINHPNFHHAVSAEDIAAAQGAQLVEIYSGHPYSASDGDRKRASAEAKWEQVLSFGRPIAAVAVDDMHALRRSGRVRSHPGTGWVEVFTADRSREAICSALAVGKLYASSGPRLSRIAVDGDTFTVWFEDAGLSVDFIDEWGKVLGTGAAAPDGEDSGSHRASYRLRGGETYVRARVTAPDGARAWTQPYWVTR